MSFRSGFVGIVGRPNVGKSTLMGAIIGEKISIISDKPQTTRNRIMGVWHGDDFQVVFLDTPGVHKGKYGINDFMLNTAFSVLSEVDILLLVVEYWETGGQEFNLLLGELRSRHRELPPVFLVVNKIDLAEDKHEILESIARQKDLFDFAGIIPVSALNGENLDRLKALIVEQMEEGPRYFPEDMITDQSERFLVAEFIREKVFVLTRDEIPHSIAVQVEQFVTEENRLVISACIYVERDSQKGMIIGKRGAMIKEIGSQARVDLERMLGTKVFLELHVKVSRDWRKTSARLREFGYTEQV
ncbi:GTPase Era [Desulfurispirillum indicum]|uniref:GTPase Era n=1 Tax=Desulfurispirillum indicum (strain ATCC BAA-1389 / DSM 22839 / S5) TaxID=653733 RepID=E6W683_DESIS|nr:GTPase Era [Desulfurispirillum indicum]ADU66119.1 GTP-binding protein Era [Desulfurispirillum indicum S5]UCZ55525.1 GTPase Era [Desulfurispirillum indicum]